LYCTTDPLYDNDRDTAGNYKFHLIPMFQSSDLVNWTYKGDAFTSRPTWVKLDAGLWAPEVRYFNDVYHLYYTASDTSLPGGGSAIGVATGPTPLGPWKDSGEPVVAPRPASFDPNARVWTFDPDIVTGPDGQRYILFGSYFGGIAGRKLSADGLHSDPASEKQVTIDNRYEGADVIQRDGYYYLFVSATNCCNGPLTGYSIFVGRSKDPLGPYVDQEGVPLLATRVGGTPVLSMNGNRWEGPGHNFVFKDFDGQWWTVYHAVDRNDPYFAGAVGFTKRPVLLDPVDWKGGWPQVRAGRWASDKDMPAPAAQPGQESRYEPNWANVDVPGDKLENFSDEFNGKTLSSKWNMVCPQGSSANFGVQNGTFNFDTQNADLYVDSNNACVLTEAAPKRANYMVEVKVKDNVPNDSSVHNYVQDGFVIYADYDNFLKLVQFANFNTRQTEFAKELSPVPNGYPRYGNTVVGPPGDWTYLRIVKGTRGDQETYRAYTSDDGRHWVRGGVWTHKLGDNAKIGLISMGGSGFTANFDYVRVYTVEKDDY
jgi:arabinan endo-1,5-alpha-L-arabinosidase